MPKVIHLAQYYWPHVGGVEKHLEQVNAQLLRKKYDLSVITLQDQPSLPLKELHNGVQVYRIPAVSEKKKLHHKFSVWGNIWQLRSHLITADIIHIHDVFWWLIPLLPFLSHKKMYITFHGYEGNNKPKWNQIFWHRLAAWWTHGNICIGDFHAKWYGVKASYISYGGVKMGTQQIVQNQKTDWAFVGRLEEDNGVFNYLQTVKTLTDSDIHFQLDIYGEGRLRRKAEHFVRKHNLPVTFHGVVKNVSGKMDAYNGIFASRYLSILEALAAGTPVIAQYNNQLQHDYLALAPFAQWITIVHEPAEIAQAVIAARPLPARAIHWARAQTWKRVAATYQLLWNHDKN